MVKGEKFLVYFNYGIGYEGNYIEVYIYGDVCLFRDIKYVYLFL